MKEYLKQLTEPVREVNLAGCIVREYLQARTLGFLQESGAFINWAFVGGTALRFLYSLPRFSEDLDFSIAEPGRDAGFTEFMKKIKNGFLAEDYETTVKIRAAGTVLAAFVKFSGLPYELDLSPHRSEVVSIKVEIDTNPPAGANIETSIVRKHTLLNLLHYDKSSLLAGKLHAILARGYAKGRDMYDLLWYLSDRSWPEPNILFLNNALKQTAWPGPVITGENWRRLIAGKLRTYDWKTIVADVRPFLEKQSDIAMLDLRNVLKLLKETSEPE